METRMIKVIVIIMITMTIEKKEKKINKRAIPTSNL